MEAIYPDHGKDRRHGQVLFDRHLQGRTAPVPSDRAEETQSVAASGLSRCAVADRPPAFVDRVALFVLWKLAGMGLERLPLAGMGRFLSYCRRFHDAGFSDWTCLSDHHRAYTDRAHQGDDHRLGRGGLKANFLLDAE